MKFRGNLPINYISAVSTYFLMCNTTSQRSVSRNTYITDPRTDTVTPIMAPKLRWGGGVTIQKLKTEVIDVYTSTLAIILSEPYCILR